MLGSKKKTRFNTAEEMNDICCNWRLIDTQRYRQAPKTRVTHVHQHQHVTYGYIYDNKDGLKCLDDLERQMLVAILEAEVHIHAENM